jgi:hypothetical protein
MTEMKISRISYAMRLIPPLVIHIDRSLIANYILFNRPIEIDQLLCNY